MFKPTMKFSTVCAAFALAMVSGGAFAQGTYNLSTCTTAAQGVAVTPSCSGSTNTYSITANVTAFGSTGTGGAFAAASITDQLGSGVGLTSAGEITGSPQHAIDNDGKVEFLLINFVGYKVDLTNYDIGWSYTAEKDVTVLRWDGSGSPVAGLSSKTAANLIDSNNKNAVGTGWTLVGDYNTDPVTVSNPDAIGSSWWIISSYFTNSTRGSDPSYFNQGDDYFKLLSFAGTCVSNLGNKACSTGPGGAPTVPEPASLVLVGLALAGVGYSRRKKSK